MEAAQQQKAAAAANGGRAASGQPQMRDSPNDNRGGMFFIMSMDFDTKTFQLEALIALITKIALIFT